MENVLIISSSRSFTEQLAGFIRDSFNSSVRAVETAYQARSILDDSSPPFDLAVINVPLSDESGVELAEFIAESTLTGCIVMARSEKAEMLSERLEKSGVPVAPKPFSKSVFYQLVKTVEVALHRSQRLYEKTLQLEGKIEEIQTVDKAKFLLMEHRGMTESEAHLYVEHYAMNKRKKKKLAAMEIIDGIMERHL